MTATSESIGSLVIDLRANVAQLRVDMDEVKNTVAKSSREMSSQMRQDMNETRQVLALMRDDFGVGVPRELRKVIASSELARTAILGIKDALFGLAFLNLGLEAFNKITSYITESAKKAQEEAKHTRDIVDAAQKAVDATFQRREQLELIGKGEEERARLQKQFYEAELQRDRTRLAGLQAQIAAKIALVNLDAIAAGTQQARGAQGSVGGGGATPEEAEAAADRARERGMKGANKFIEDLKPQIEAAQKAIAEVLAGSKTNDVQLADFEKALGLSRIKNEETLALKDIELKQDSVEKMYQIGKIGIDQELIALRTAATQKYDIQSQALQGTLDILEKDPSRNKEKIEQTQTQLALMWKDYEKTLTDIAAKGTEERTKLRQEEIALEAGAMRGLIDSNKDHGLIPADLFGMGGGKPGLNPDMKGAAVDRFAGTFKDAAAQGKLLEKAMDDLLTPMDKFRIEQQEIEILKNKFKDYPEVIKALNAEMLKANPEFQKLMEASAEFGKDFANELDQLILKGESFSDFLKNIAKDIEEIALKALLLKPLEDFFSGGKSGTGGISGFLGKLFSGLGFAGGGDPPVGQLSVVGENGPELFMPSSAGTIIPNGALGGDTYYFSIDARGAAPGSEGNIIRGLQRALEQNRRASVASAIDYQRRR